MNKNWLAFAFLFVVILVAALSYWLGYSAGSVHRFVPYGETIHYALDSKTGQLCRTDASSGDTPQCKDLK